MSAINLLLQPAARCQQAQGYAQVATIRTRFLHDSFELHPLASRAKKIENTPIPQSFYRRCQDNSREVAEKQGSNFGLFFFTKGCACQSFNHVAALSNSMQPQLPTKPCPRTNFFLQPEPASCGRQHCVATSKSRSRDARSA